MAEENRVILKGSGGESKEDAMASVLEKASEAFTANNYSTALELYNKVLAYDLNNVDNIACRAHTLIKLDKYSEALIDADRAIDLARANPSIWSDTSLTKAFLRGGVASFHLGQSAKAKNYFKEGFKLDSNPRTGLRQWQVWCDEKMAKEAKKTAEIDALKAVALAKAKAAEPEVVVKVPVPALVNMHPSKIKHDWYQTETSVVVEVRIKGLNTNTVTVEFGQRSLSVTAKMPNTDSEYSLELDLAHPIMPDNCGFKVLRESPKKY
jgi:suppressor of G2 allele of SKP1